VIGGDLSLNYSNTSNLDIASINKRYIWTEKKLINVFKNL